jgi:putative hydrolase of the HAD superfamily
MPVSLIGIDADDTLWHNETVFRMTHQRFNELLGEFAPPEDIEATLNQTEQRNIAIYGYGAKGFTLSMIETALEVSGGRVSGAVMREIMNAGKDMMRHPVAPLPGVEAALSELAQRGKLILITKGDLFHQESKLAASGLGSRFSGVEIVSEKTPDIYQRIFQRHGGTPDRALMAGNSMRSDVLPMLEAGGYAAYVPYPLIWSHEAADPPGNHPRFRELPALADLCIWLDELQHAGKS